MENLPSVVLAHEAAVSKTNISQLIAAQIRAAMHGVTHQAAIFGEEILDVLFDLFAKKVEEHFTICESGKK